MTLIFVSEVRMVRHLENGKFYSLESSFSYNLFQRYLTYFSDVVIFARVRDQKIGEVLIEENWVDQKSVLVYGLPYYVGFNQFVIKYFSYRKAIHQGLAIHEKNAVLLCRLPGRAGVISASYFKSINRNYAVEVVGDPFEALSGGAIKHPLAFLIKYFSRNSLRKVVRNASLALYVTTSTLQKRYPCLNESFGVSDVVLDQNSFRVKPKNFLADTAEIKLIAIGSLEQMYKAPDVAIDAVALLRSMGYNVTLTWVGDGKHKLEMIAYAFKKKVDNAVSFIGKLPSGAPIHQYLDAADIFIMPSRTEGLPRAMVEAMARSLPCIGTRITGILELLTPEFIIDINNAEQLAAKVLTFIKNQDLRNDAGIRNFKKAKEYDQARLSALRGDFFTRLVALSK
jgi:glycosyltransferase involved in cell wall biosynthesis